MKIGVSSLTPGETFHIWRRLSGIPEKNIADIFQVCPRTVRNWEKDRSASTLPDMRSELPNPLPPYVLCYILRRRLGLTARQFAKTFGVTQQCLSRWEVGLTDWKRLQRYFEKLGWEFE